MINKELIKYIETNIIPRYEKNDKAHRDLIPIHIIERTILFNLERFQQYDKEYHFIGSKEHIESKYGEEGYLKLWLDSEVNNKRLEKLRNLISDESRFERVFEYYFEKHKMEVLK